MAAWAFYSVNSLLEFSHKISKECMLGNVDISTKKAKSHLNDNQLQNTEIQVEKCTLMIWIKCNYLLLS